MTDQPTEPCPGFPDSCPNLRNVDPNPPQHYGGIRCGCADQPTLATSTAEPSVIAASNVQHSLISIPNTVNKSVVTIHPDGRLEFGEGYEPDEAARTFWDAVQRLAPDPMTREFGAPLKARIDAELAAGQRAEKKLEALTEAVVLWRDRPGGDVGLAIALAGILDTEKPEPPAATALVRVLKECDRLERAVRDNPTNPDLAGGYLACLRHIREAAGVIPADSEGV